LFDVLAEASERVAEASKRNDKVSVLAEALSQWHIGAACAMAAR
jgi:hypothetical protein